MNEWSTLLLQFGGGAVVAFLIVYFFYSKQDVDIDYTVTNKFENEEPKDEET